MKYNVSVAVDGRIDIKVDANSFEEAKQKIDLSNVDLRNLDIVGYHAVNAEDALGNFTDY